MQIYKNGFICGGETVLLRCLFILVDITIDKVNDELCLHGWEHVPGLVGLGLALRQDVLRTPGRALTFPLVLCLRMSSSDNDGLELAHVLLRKFGDPDPPCADSYPDL